LVGGYLDFKLAFGMTMPHISIWVGSSHLMGSPPTGTHVACTTQHQLLTISFYAFSSYVFIVKSLEHFKKLVDCDLLGSCGTLFMMNHYEIVMDGTKTSQWIAEFEHKSWIGKIVR
jgi:hypothetical protein